MVLKPLDVVATNVSGSGAVELAKSLLPALEADPRLAVERLYLPDRGPLAAYRPIIDAAAIPTHRRLPNAISRILECTVGARRFDRGVPLLVLGDLPLAVKARQTVIVQNAHLLSRFSPAQGSDAVKYAVMRVVFSANAGRAAAIVVQSTVMRDALLAEYAVAAERVHVIQQPPPTWLLDDPRAVAHRPERRRLRLFYPAAGYPHKNHILLGRVDTVAWDRLVERLVVTLPAATSPASSIASITSVGHLDPAAMRVEYATADALLFLSTAESYGFPLVEAMWLGLPIVAADLPYAHALCGDQAVYFDPSDGAHLLRALGDLRTRLDAGWRPDWREQLAPIPRDWAAVAAQVAAVAVD